VIIETENLTKIYRTDEIETTALNQVNLQLQKGEFVSIMGPSGCGKSTLLHVLGLIDDLSNGIYRFLGEDVSKCSERKRSIILKNI
jgi:putative ABC transport system ATP-binding protein